MKRTRSQCCISLSLCRSSSTECSTMTAWGRSFDVFHSHQMGLSCSPQVPTQHAQNVAFTWHFSGENLMLQCHSEDNLYKPSSVLCFNLSWMCGDWRKHHKYHLHLFQEEPQEVTFVTCCGIYSFPESLLPVLKPVNDVQISLCVFQAYRPLAVSI